MENRGCLREIPTTWLCHMIYMIELFQSKDGLRQEKNHHLCLQPGSADHSGFFALLQGPNFSPTPNQK